MFSSCKIQGEILTKFENLQEDLNNLWAIFRLDIF